MKLKRYRKRKIGTYISFGIIIIIFSLILSFVIIDYLANKSRNVLLPIAESMTRKVVTMIINSACDESMIEDDLYIINKNRDDEIEMITYNSFEVTKLINQVTSNFETKIRQIENGEINYYGYNDELGGIIAEIPIGVIFGNTMLSNIGPKIKVRLNMLGDIVSNIETEVKPYGINNAYVELRIFLEVTARIVLPFASEKVVISNVIPLSMNIVQGSIPEAYISSFK